MSERNCKIVLEKKVRIYNFTCQNTSYCHASISKCLEPPLISLYFAGKWEKGALTY